MVVTAGGICQFSFNCNISEMILARWASSGAQKLIARPLFPARAVRPMRWTCTSGSQASSKLTTSSSDLISRPRAATSVATNIRTLPLAKRTRVWSRSRCSKSPCNAIALCPTSFSASQTNWQSFLVLQNTTQDDGWYTLSRRCNSEIFPDDDVS